MAVGINGMGRIGRLALRAAFGGMERPADDPRAGNRLDIAHVNEIKGDAGVTAHLLNFASLHGRWRTEIGADGERLSIGNRRILLQRRRFPGRRAVGRARLRYRA